MKKMISLITLIVAWSVFPISGNAAGLATFFVDQENIASEVGSTFDLDFNIDAAGEKLDTARLVLSFDPLIVRAEAVVLSGAFDRSAPGNYIDNKTGKIFWGGFTLSGPFTAKGAFAKVTFKSQKEGTTTVGFSGDSKLISDGEEKINLNSLKGSTVNVSAGVMTEELETISSNSSFSVISPTHKNENVWYSNNQVEITWEEIPGENSVTDYYYGFDQTSNTNPTEKVSGNEFSKTFKDVEDGIHYFHLRGVLKDGTETKVIHRKVKVDVSDPNPFEVTVSDKQVIEGETLYFTFGTTDDVSGVINYQYSINDGEFKPGTSPLEIDDLEAGTYFVRVGATDRAGNTEYYGKSVRVYPEGTELDRPEEYSVVEEVEAVTEAKADQGQKQKQKNILDIRLLALIGFVALLLIGIVYRIVSRKKRNNKIQ